MKKTLLILVCLLISFVSFSQPKKTIKEKKIKSLTVWQTEINDGKEITYKDSYEEYDKKGRTVLSIEYKKDGTIKKKETTTYDNYDNVIEEMKFNLKENKFIRKSHKFNANNDEIEEIEYNIKNEVIGKTIFTYNTNGDKVSESQYDGNDKLLKKHVYTYSSPKIKAGRKTTNDSNVIESTRKYIYEFLK